MVVVPIKDPEAAVPSVAYVILRRTKDGYTEVGINAFGELMIRYTQNGTIKAVIPMGPATKENLLELNMMFDELAHFINPEI